MKARIESRPAFSVLAVSRMFSEATCTTEIPKFWETYYARGYGEFACGQYAVCYDAKPDGTFRYAIGNGCTVESRPDGSRVYHIFSRPDRTAIPAGFELLNIPAGTWAEFECLGPLPGSIQSMWPRVYREWLPDSGYEKVPGFDLEEYGVCETPEDAQKPDYRCFIRIPVRWRREEAESGFTVRVDGLTGEEYIRLFRSPGWEAPELEQVETALRHSCAVFSLYSDGVLIGMGRLIGDRALAYLCRDVVVLPEFQHQGAGSFLMRSMLEWIADDLPAGGKASCELFSATGKTSFYQRFGFQPLPNASLETGMMRMVEGRAR